MKNSHYADSKPRLIDLEASNIATGGKQEYNSVQPERLSDGGYYMKTTIMKVYW
jgi:hypothetical protein